MFNNKKKFRWQKIFSSKIFFISFDSIWKWSMFRSEFTVFFLISIFLSFLIVFAQKTQETIMKVSSTTTTTWTVLATMQNSNWNWFETIHTQIKLINSISSLNYAQTKKFCTMTNFVWPFAVETYDFDFFTTRKFLFFLGSFELLFVNFWRKSTISLFILILISHNSKFVEGPNV